MAPSWARPKHHAVGAHDLTHAKQSSEADKAPRCSFADELPVKFLFRAPYLATARNCGQAVTGEAAAPNVVPLGGTTRRRDCFVPTTKSAFAQSAAGGQRAIDQAGTWPGWPFTVRAGGCRATGAGCGVTRDDGRLPALVGNFKLTPCGCANPGFEDSDPWPYASEADGTAINLEICAEPHHQLVEESGRDFCGVGPACCGTSGRRDGSASGTGLLQLTFYLLVAICDFWHDAFCGEPA